MRVQARLAPITAFLILCLLLAWGHWREGSLFWSWDWLGVPAMPPPRLPFTDTISVTNAIDCLRAGFDPYLTGRCDPWGRLFNYPAVWLQLSRLPISGGSADVLGTSMAAMAMLAMVVVFHSRSRAAFVIIVLALLSPSVVYGFERGNVDVLLYALLTFGLFGTRGLERDAQQAARAALIVGLTVLKIYPVAAAILLLDRTGRGLAFALVTVVAAAAAFTWSSWGHISSILANTPLTSFYSYGAAPLFLDVRDALGIAGIDAAHLRWIASGAALALGIAAIAAAFIGAHSFNSSPSPAPTLARRDFVDDLCLASLAIFCFSFLLGSNFNYRLIFLTGTLPKLIESFEAQRRVSALAAAAIVVALLWAVRLPVAANHLLQWTVYMAAFVWVFHSALERVTRSNPS